MKSIATIIATILAGTACMMAAAAGAATPDRPTAASILAAKRVPLGRGSRISGAVRGNGFLPGGLPLVVLGATAAAASVAAVAVAVAGKKDDTPASP